MVSLPFCDILEESEFNTVAERAEFLSMSSSRLCAAVWLGMEYTYWNAEFKPVKLHWASVKLYRMIAVVFTAKAVWKTLLSVTNPG